MIALPRNNESPKEKAPPVVPVGASVSLHVDPNYRMQKIPAPPAAAGTVSITIELRILRMG
jgi:hypothetical protein